jgi:plasmid stabilization system protein ParE
LKNRRIRFTATAQEHVRRDKAWWLANRDHADVFIEELEQALKIIATLPGVGTLYAQAPVPGVRRVYLRKVAAHLYDTFDDAQVIVRALWGAHRERGPWL